MQSKRMGSTIYLRVDKDEDVLEAVERTCADLGVTSAVFSGIGACERVAIGTYIPEKKDFRVDEASAMFEMVSLNGDISEGADGKGVLHAHGAFAYLDETGEHRMIGGHLVKVVVGYTAEIEIRPVEGRIGRIRCPAVDIDVWDLS